MVSKSFSSRRETSQISRIPETGCDKKANTGTPNPPQTSLHVRVRSLKGNCDSVQFRLEICHYNFCCLNWTSSLLICDFNEYTLFCANRSQNNKSIAAWKNSKHGFIWIFWCTFPMIINFYMVRKGIIFAHPLFLMPWTAQKVGQETGWEWGVTYGKNAAGWIQTMFTCSRVNSIGCAMKQLR